MSNNWSAVIPQLLAQGMLCLRQMAIMPKLVNRGYEATAGNKGDTVTIPLSSAVTTIDVTPAITPPANADSVPTSITIVLDQWKEAAFYLTDKQMLEVMEGTIPMQAKEAIKSIANTVDAAILANYKSIYGYSGVAGATPFANDVSAFLTGRRNLTNQLADVSPRFMVMDADAEANALGLRMFQDVSYRGDAAGINEGIIGYKLGAQWAVDQNIPTHTAGTASGATTDSAGYAVGVKTITLASAGTGTILVGDIIQFAGDNQTYAVTSGDSNVANGGTISFEPGLKVAIAASPAAITVKPSHVVNLYAHRDCISFVSRPFAGADPLGLGYFQSAVDPVSGLSLRLEATRQHKQTRFAFDILYGTKCTRPEFGNRIAG